jgi:hypothetical protein
MPVIATAESRRQLAWRSDISFTVEDVTDLVGILLLHAGQREASETLRSTRIERRGFRREANDWQKKKRERESLHPKE